MERLFGLDFQLIHDVIFTGINIFILFFLLSYMLFNPVRDFLKKRQEKIKTELEDAAANQASALSMKAEYEEKLAQVNKEAEAILETARKKALKREDQIISEAKEEAARIIARANNEIELEKKKALDDLKQEMISVAALMAGKAISASMDDRIQDSLVEETLKEIGDETWLS